MLSYFLDFFSSFSLCECQSGAHSSFLEDFAFLKNTLLSEIFFFLSLKRGKKEREREKA